MHTSLALREGEGVRYGQEERGEEGGGHLKRKAWQAKYMRRVLQFDRGGRVLQFDIG